MSGEEGAGRRRGEGALRRTVVGIARSYRELRVYQTAFEAAMEIFKLTKTFPPEERYSMVDQMRRSSRSVCSNIADSWRKRRYEEHSSAS